MYDKLCDVIIMGFEKEINELTTVKNDIEIKISTLNRCIEFVKEQYDKEV